MTIGWTPEAIKEVALEVARRDATGLAGVRRVRVCLTPAFRLPSGEDRRRLILVTDKSECRGLVEPDVSWDAVLAQVEMLLALEDESRAAAHVRETVDAQLGRASR